MTRAAALVALALAATACDAGRRIQLDAHVTDARDGSTAIGDTLRVFWFDDARDELFDRPVEEQVRRVGDERAHRAGNGVIQTDWSAAHIDSTGTAQVSLMTFYAGTWVMKDESPEGLWFEIVPATSKRTPQAFVVRRAGGTPTLVRLKFADGRWRPDVAAGSIDVGSGSAWRVSLPLEPWQRR